MEGVVGVVSGRWLLGAALGLTVLAGGVYLCAQQIGRVGADDVPRAVAAVSAQRLEAGRDPTAVVGDSSVELSSAARPFVIVLNTQHQVLASDATVHGEPPTVPPGVLDVAAANGSNRVTWQPAQGVREALVAMPWASGTAKGVVVAGVGLGPSEDRTARVGTVTAVDLAAAMAILTALFLWDRHRPRRHRHPT